MADDEAEYYRAVEDYFATLRGGPHTLSPKDVQLLRGWWRDRVPLLAVTSGIAEAVAGRRERGERDPVVSLGYCRHAVRRRSRELAELRAGGADSGPESRVAGDASCAGLERLAGELEAAATRVAAAVPAAPPLLETVAAQVRAAAALPPEALDRHLFDLEAALLEGCWRALPEEVAARLEATARDAAVASKATDTAQERTFRALRDRGLRELLELPRLELE